MAVGCSYVANGTIKGKQQYSYPPRGARMISPWYAEMRIIIFSLNHFEKHMGVCSGVFLYTDLIDIQKLLGSDQLFKKNQELQRVRSELKSQYNKKRAIYGERLTVSYLPAEKRGLILFTKVLITLPMGWLGRSYILLLKLSIFKHMIPNHNRCLSRIEPTTCCDGWVIKE
jgi:hypothetical protein